MIYAFNFFVQTSFSIKDYFLIDKIDLTTRGPLYTCLVLYDNRNQSNNVLNSCLIFVLAGDCVVEDIFPGTFAKEIIVILDGKFIRRVHK